MLYPPDVTLTDLSLLNAWARVEEVHSVFLLLRGKINAFTDNIEPKSDGGGLVLKRRYRGHR